MMNNTHKDEINKNQLFALIIMFEIGTTNLFALGIKAKQDAWIAILTSMLVGFIYLWIFTELAKAFPQKNLTEIIIAILGKRIGIPMAFFYGLLWIYPSARNMHHISFLIKMTFLQETPHVIIDAILILVQLYLFFLGIKVFARTSEIIMPFFISIIILMIILVFSSGVVHLKNITPILSGGFNPILKALIPTGISFPFSEMFIFTMYWCYVTPVQTIRRTSFTAVGLSGLLLSFTSIILISVLGVKYASSTTIPALEVIKLINIKDIITNLDSLGVIIIFLGGLYKTYIYFFACVTTFSTLLNMKNNKIIAIPIGIFILWYSTFYEPNYPFLMWMTDTNAYFILIPLIQVMPCLLLILYYLKKKTGYLK